MQDSAWSRWNQKFNKIHLQDTELHTGTESVYINPAVKLAVGWGVFLLAFLLFLVIGKPFVKKEANTDVHSSGEEVVSSEDYVPFERNEYPEVNSFVENYLNALTNADINVLNTMVVDTSQFDIAWLEERREYILSYSNVDCYTKPGLTEGSYVVYAVVNTEIADVNVEIQPLSLHQFYLIPNEYGGFLQDNTTGTNPDIDAYLAQIEQDPDVVKLYERVNQNNEEAANADAALKAFYERINMAQ